MCVCVCVHACVCDVRAYHTCVHVCVCVCPCVCVSVCVRAHALDKSQHPHLLLTSECCFAISVSSTAGTTVADNL